jgi:hypothetical protein
MGKFLIGCLGVGLLLSVAGIGVVWWKFGDDISAGVGMVSGGIEAAGEFAKLQEEFEKLDATVANRASFRAPSDAQLAEPQFERFMAAHQQMRAVLEGRLQELDAKYDQQKQDLEAEGGQMGLAEMAEAYGDLAELLIDAKRAQVEALNAQDFSLEEYRWTRNTVYKALGESVAVAAISQGADGGQFNQTIPQETIDLVEPHRQELMETYVLAWWGL